MGSFGKTTAGSGSSASSTTKLAASQFTPTGSGTITAGHAHMWLSASGSFSAALLLYADASGAPGALLASSNTVTVTQTSDAAPIAFTFSGANQVEVTAGTPYWIVEEWSDPGTPSVNIGRDSTTNGRLEVQGFTFGSPPNPFGTGTALTGPIAAWIDYTPHGTASAPLGFTASAIGTRTRFGTATASLGFTAAAAGRDTTVRGTATAQLGFTAAAVTLVTGTATANLGGLTAAVTRAVVETSRPLPAVYPSDSLYPSESLYPSDGTTPGIANPNWPVVGVEVDFSSGPPNRPGASRRSVNAPYRRLTVRGFSTSRGRQYELDQAQAGGATLDIPDPLELLNPDNAASPFNQGKDALEVTPYRAMWIWAMWPNQPGSGNIINTGVHPSYDASFEAGTGLWAGVDLSTQLARSTVQAWTGSHSLAVVQGASGHSYGVSNVFRTAPDLTYTFSAYVRPTGGCTVRIRVVDAQGGTTLSEAATAQDTWTRLSVTWTTVDTLEPITIYGTGDAPPQFFVDGTQLEFGAAVTDWTANGPSFYPIFTGYVERYPTTYDMSGSRALRPLEAVDGLAVLSRTEIRNSYDAEVLADTPVLSFKLDNTAPPASTDLLGSGFGAGGRTNFVVASNGQINWGGETNPDGTAAVVFTAQNPNDPPTSFPSGSFTEMAALGGSISLDTAAGFTVEVWAKWTSGTAQVGTLELLADGDPRGLNTSVPLVGWCSFASNRLAPTYNKEGTSAFARYDAGVPPDGEWHHMVVTVQGTKFRCYLDGVDKGSTTVTSVGHIGFNTFYSEATSQYTVPQAQVATSRFAVYTGVLSADRIKAHYDRGTGYVGETSGARAIRLLTAYWGGAWVVYTGLLPMSSDLEYSGRTVLDVLQEIMSSEQGLAYMDRNGAVVVEGRTARYANQQALWVFGENPPGATPAEYPYSEYKADHDPTYVFTQFNLSRPDNSNYPSIVNEAAEVKYGQRVAQQELKVIRDFDLDQAGIFYEARYAAPKTRISTLTLVPSANPALWPVVLGLEISQRIRVTRRSAFLFSAEYYVEAIDHKVDAASGEWSVSLQCSPVFVPQAWVLGDSTNGVLDSTTIPVY